MSSNLIREECDPMDNTDAVYCPIFRGMMNPYKDQVLPTNEILRQWIVLCDCGKHYVERVNTCIVCSKHISRNEKYCKNHIKNEV